MRTRTLIAATLAAALAGCGACDTVPPDAIEDCDTSVVLPGSVKTDILFVIDDSGSMLDEQLRVRAALGRFVDRLASSPIANDFQIGVTNTSVQTYDGGTSYTAGPSAGQPYPRGALVAVNAPTVGDILYTTAGLDPGFFGTQILTWDSESLTTDFRNNILQGIDGAGREQPFAAARLALSDRLADENAGFVRPGARLAIIFLTDEDDCSGPQSSLIQSNANCQTRRNDASVLTAVSDFAAFLRGPIAGQERDVVVAAIAGLDCPGGVCNRTNPQLCTDALTTPNRIIALLDAMPTARTRLASICDANFDQALDAFAEAILSQTLPLDGAVADYRMLTAQVRKADGRIVSCPIASDAEPLTSTVGAFYEPPRGGLPPSLTFVNGCALATGDSVDVNVLCIR